MTSGAPDTNGAAPLKGLVLAGGRSTRMGHDKSRIHWHGREQQYYLADLLREFCAQVYISCREGQAVEIQAGYPTLTDYFPQAGPLTAIRSAFHYEPNSAWLVIACDLPLLDSAHLQQLIAERSPFADATAFQSPRDGSPEPLAAIWEMRSQPKLEAFATQGFNCPRKILLQINTHLVVPRDPLALTNVNTPEEESRVRAILAQV